MIFITIKYVKRFFLWILGIAGIKISSPIREQAKADNDRSPTNVEQSDTDVIQTMHDADSRNADEGPEISTNEENDVEQLINTMR